MNKLMQCDHITKRVGNFILRDIHFELEPGYILGVIGSNGAGKSTLTRVLLGSYKLYNHDEDYTNQTAEAMGMAANRGDVLIDGYSIKRNPREYKAQTAYVLNESPFAMEMSAKENGILYGGYYKGFDRKRYQQLCEKYEVPFQTVLKKLSKGEQIKMQLAFALSYEARIYIFDEPAGNLDVRFREEFYEIMRDIVKSGEKSIVYVTHLVEELELLADYVLWMEKGGQKGFGTLENLLDEYILYSGLEEVLQKDVKCKVIGRKQNASHMEVLVSFLIRNWLVVYLMFLIDRGHLIKRNISRGIPEVVGFLPVESVARRQYVRRKSYLVSSVFSLYMAACLLICCISFEGKTVNKASVVCMFFVVFFSFLKTSELLVAGENVKYRRIEFSLYREVCCPLWFRTLNRMGCIVRFGIAAIGFYWSIWGGMSIGGKEFSWKWVLCLGIFGILLVAIHSMVMRHSVSIIDMGDYDMKGR